MRTYARPKKIQDQVIVITGASSGIGLATARMAAQRGARVVLSSFDELALKQATEDIQKQGGQVICQFADISKEEDMVELARAAIRTYGRIDTWINNAGVHIFGEIDQTEIKDARRIFDVNYWGTVTGSQIAIPYLIETKGSLINVASVLSSHPLPLQGYYEASKHAIKSYTHSLRMELEARKIPVAISLISPSAIHTPIVSHSKNLLRKKAQLPSPHYSPDVAARGILACTTTPHREVVIGASGLIGLWGEKLAPYFVDQFMKLKMFEAQKTKGIRRNRNALFQPLGDAPKVLDEDSRFILNHSAYTWMQTHPKATLTMLIVSLAFGWALTSSKRHGNG